MVAMRFSYGGVFRFRTALRLPSRALILAEYSYTAANETR